MKIAMLGLKGLPGIHGGVEKHVEELGSRLVKQGHEVTVFCRKSYTDKIGDYNGMKLLYAPTIHTKHLDATIHTILGGVKGSFSDFDLIHYHAIGPASISFIPRLFGKPVIATVHSLDFLRDKWSAGAKWMLKRAEDATFLFANRIIVVSRQLEERYKGKYKSVRYIPNGVAAPEIFPPKIITDKWRLKGGDYLFWAGRFSPEKGVHYLVDAFTELDIDCKLVLAGGVNHTEKYMGELKAKIEKDNRIITTGFLEGQPLYELFSNARVFVLPSEHEGLPVALLEAMSYGIPALVSDIPPCREVGDTAERQYVNFFNSGDIRDLSEKLLDMVLSPEKDMDRGKAGMKHVLNTYSWDKIAMQTEEEYKLLLGKTI